MPPADVRVTAAANEAGGLSLHWPTPMGLLEWPE